MAKGEARSTPLASVQRYMERRLARDGVVVVGIGTRCRDVLSSGWPHVEQWGAAIIIYAIAIYAITIKAIIIQVITI